MYRQIITPQNTQLLLELPAGFVGKQVEVIAYIKKRVALKKRSKKLENILKFYSQFNFSTNQIKFTRDELHER